MKEPHSWTWDKMKCRECDRVMRDRVGVMSSVNTIFCDAVRALCGFVSSVRCPFWGSVVLVVVILTWYLKKTHSNLGYSSPCKRTDYLVSSLCAKLHLAGRFIWQYMSTSCFGLDIVTMFCCWLYISTHTRLLKTGPELCFTFVLISLHFQSSRAVVVLISRLQTLEWMEANRRPLASWRVKWRKSSLFLL